MKRYMLLPLLLLLAVVALSWGFDRGWAQPSKSSQELKYKGKVTTAEKKAAAKRAKSLGLKPGVAGMDAAEPAGLQPEVDSGKVLRKKGEKK